MHRASLAALASLALTLSAVAEAAPAPTVSATLAAASPADPTGQDAMPAAPQNAPNPAPQNAPNLAAPPTKPAGPPPSTPTTDTSQSIESGEMVRAPGSPARTAIPERVTSNISRQYFFLHDDNYFALQANGSWPPRVKFQVSFRFEMLSFGDSPNVAVNFSYTQKSFWDLFAFDRSSPFIENDYRPELFVSIRPDEKVRYREIQIGVQHESNGLGDDGGVNQTDNSRSWNYLFADARWGFTRDDPRKAWFYLTPGLRAWIPFGFQATDNAGYDLRKYEGYLAGILDLDLRIPDHPNFGRLSARFTVREHNQQADLFYPIYGKVRCWLFSQFFHGQAERLITVADDVSAIYVGLGFQ
jgi:outer membrane phospholipase A